MSSFFITFKSKSNKNKKKKKSQAQAAIPAEKRPHKHGPTRPGPFFSFHVVSPFFFKKNNKNK
jgi:hypothetical protein